METCAPEIIPHISTCKSPHMMVGAVLKTYFAEVGAGGLVQFGGQLLFGGLLGARSLSGGGRLQLC